MRIGCREKQRRGAIEAKQPGAQNYRRSVARLAGVAIELRTLAAVNQIGMQRIGRHVAVFFYAHRGPVAKGDFAEVAAAGGADRAAFLLSAIDPVGKLVVGDDVIELRRRLVVPGAPGLAAIHADGRALVYGEGDDVGAFGIDPDGVVVVAAGRALDGRKVLASVGGSVGRSVGHIDHIFLSRIDAHAGKVVAASNNAFFGIHELPAFAGIVGTINAAVLPRIHQGVHAIGIAWRNG